MTAVVPTAGSLQAGLSMRRAGSGGLLIDCGDLDGALRVFAALDAARVSGALSVDELIPAAQTVLVSGGDAQLGLALASRLRQLIAESVRATDPGAAVTPAAGSETPVPRSAVTEIPVVYDGADLREVAALTGLSEEAVVRRHAAADYTVAFTGFAPGFAYLAGGDPLLTVPRRATPRPRIPAGAVGLAGQFSGVYPRVSPGGWQLIGHTDTPMWDTGRAQPAVLIAGGRVRFRPIRAAAITVNTANTVNTTSAGEVSPEPGVPEPVTSEPVTPEPVTPTPAVLRIDEPGVQTLIEDLGRPGYAGMGVGVAGSAIPLAAATAQRLVGNPRGAAALELSQGGFAATALDDVVLALTGATRAGRITGEHGTRWVHHATPFRLSAGEQVEFGPPEQGLRSVLALRGGIGAHAVLGSRSRDTLAGLGPEPLRAGDVLWASGATLVPVAAPELAPTPLPCAGELVQLRILLGPRDDWFPQEALTRLTTQPWEVTPRSDRVGVRLAGDPLSRADAYATRELPSEGMVLGAIQVPPDGQPVIFLADRPLTGGYPVVAVVHAADRELAAQLPPGSLVQFTAVSGDPHAQNQGHTSIQAHE